MIRRTYQIREVPAQYLGEGEFNAPPGWDLFCLWAHDGKVYGIFEKETVE